MSVILRPIDSMLRSIVSNVSCPGIAVSMTTRPPSGLSAMYTCTCGRPGNGVGQVTREMPGKGIANEGRS